jgi:hypothetical protein
MNKKNESTLRVRFKFKEGTAFSPAVQNKVESACASFVAQIFDYCASRGVAFPSGVHLNFPNGSRQKFSRTTPKALTKRQKEILRESGARILADFLQSVAQSDEERDAFGEWKQNYDKAFFGKTSNSDTKREAMEFLRRWRNAELYDRESGTAEAISLVAPLRMVFLTPLLNALKRLDVDFFEGLAEAVRILDKRIYNSKDRNIGSGDTYIDKWLLEYRLTLPQGKSNLTMRELHELISKFWPVSIRKLRTKCKEFVIHTKPDARGKAAKRYGTVTGKILI